MGHSQCHDGRRQKEWLRTRQTGEQSAGKERRPEGRKGRSEITSFEEVWNEEIHEEVNKENLQETLIPNP